VDGAAEKQEKAEDGRRESDAAALVVEQKNLERIPPIPLVGSVTSFGIEEGGVP
jgi:hypothetical protein